MVGMESEGEFLLGYTPCGMFEIVLRPVRGDRRPPRPVPCPELPRPPFFVPPPRTPSPQEQRDTPGGAEGIFCTPRMKQEETSPLLPFTTVIKREPVTPTPRPPPPRVAAAEGSIPPFRPPPPRWANSPQDPAPYQGIIVTEALPRQSSPCAEVRVEQLPIGVRVTTRTTTLDEHIEPVAEDLSLPRGVIRPHSVSPFTRNVKTKKEVDEAGDMEEALSCLLDFSKRTGLTTPPPPPPPMVRNFSTSTPRRPSSGPVTPFVLTPSTTPRPPSPPTILSRQPNLPLNIARPRPILRPSALGAPSSPVEEEELPDIPESPASPTVSDLTMISTLSTYYSSEEDEDENEDEEYSEHEYADPYEEEGPYSSTPPPDCDPAHPHNVCVPPAWGELITGPAVICRCILCHEDGRHHAIRCRQCRNAPGCCACIWGYMRSRYNSGCPLCRSGDPKGENPLRSEIHRRLPPRRRGGTLVGVGLVRGRGRRSRSYPPDYEQQQEQEEQAQRPPQRARRGRRGRGRGRAVTIEEDQPMN